MMRLGGRLMGGGFVYFGGRNDLNSRGKFFGIEWVTESMRHNKR
jgi:hypothetical protein